MMKMNKIFPFIAFFCLLLAACNKEEVFNSNENNEELQYVTVNIDVAAGGLVPMTGNEGPATKSVCAGTAGISEDIVCDAVFPEASLELKTKAINDPAIAENTVIKNLWIIQYDGAGDEAKLIGSPVYIENFDAVETSKSVKLVASTAVNTIVFLANTFDKNISFPNSTINDLKNRVFATPSLGTILSKEHVTGDVGATIGTFPNDGDYYQRLNGYVEQIITEGSTISCALGHNACRVSLNVTNNTAGTTYPVTLTSADIENVPGCVYYFTDYDGYTSGDKAGKPISHPSFSTYGLKKFTDVITWNSSDGTSTSTKSARLYLSANESGTVINNPNNPKLKPLIAPSTATTLTINGTFWDGVNNIPIRYIFALGENMINNYQLVPNGDYEYNITIRARGDKTTDSRVQYDPLDGIDYTQTSTWPLSNCYICNPPSVATVSSTYKIPVARVDQFWGNGNYENEPNNCLGQTNAWTVSVIWSDMEIKADNFVITKSTGNGKDDYFEVSVPGTTEMGNVVIGIKNNLSTDWLWSWHLWVTDYHPDDAAYLDNQGAFIPGTDTYRVSGGVVQRYRAASAGTLQKVYMDRTVGAMSTKNVGTGKGVLFYQFGRKDPFPNNSDYWEGGTNKVASYTRLKQSASATDSSPCNVPYSVMNPTTFITGNPWTYNDKYNPIPYNNTIQWQDPYLYSDGSQKSIFDPSPSGWKVPNDYNGLTYVMAGEGTVICKTSINPSGNSVEFVTGIGYIKYTGEFTTGTTPVCLYSTTRSVSEKTIYYYYSTISNFAHNNYPYEYAYRGTANLVRPVQE